MAKQIDKTTLQYLGEDFQYKLVKEFMERKGFFENLISIVDQNAFTSTYLRSYVGTMLNYYKKHSMTPSYSAMKIALHSQANTDTDIELYDGLLEKLHNTQCDGSDQVTEVALRFFKQQRVLKLANTLIERVAQGDIEYFDKHSDELKNVLNIGLENDYEETRLFDGLDDVLSKDFRTTIPTGIDDLDLTLNGGIGTGELGVIVGPSGYGKALGINELVLTDHGFVKMGKLKITDKVIGDDGLPHNITGIFPQGKRQLYRVSFTDGTSVLCDIEHLWSVNSYYQRVSKKHIPGKSYKTEKGYWTKYVCPDNSYKTLTLGQILEKGVKVNGGKAYNFKVPITQPVQLQKRNVSINPYTMGVILGDGCIGKNRIQVGMHPDDFMLIKDYLDKSDKRTINEDVHRLDTNTYLSKIIYGKEFTEKALLYFNKQCPHSGEKYIPEDYLYNSLENRIALLNGLMDTDGTCSKNGFCSYSTKSERLAKDIKLLVESLGGCAIIRAKKKGYKNKETGKFIDCGIHYNVTVGLFDENIPIFRLERKQKRVKYRQKNWKYICSIEKAGVEEAQCIAIDSPNHLYLTNDFIVTHNTSMTTSMALHAAGFKSAQNNYEGFKVLQIVFEDQTKQIKRKHFSKITQVEACNLSKEEYAEEVRKILDTYEDREMIQNNLRIVRLKSGTKTADFIEKLIKEHINKGFRPDIVFLDYFECLKMSGNSTMTKWEKESETMRKIEAMVNEYNIAFWVPVQGNRESINTELVTMDNAGGSLGKIQIAHIIVSITRSQDDIKANMATVSVLKNRAGASGRVFEGIGFNNGTCTITSSPEADCMGGIDFFRPTPDSKDQLLDDMKKEMMAEIYSSTSKKNKKSR